MYMYICIYMCMYVYVCVCVYIYIYAFPGGSVVKNLPANAEDTGDAGTIPGLGRFPGEGNGYPLQYSCLESPMVRGP